MSQGTEHHLQAPDLPSHEHGRKQILRRRPKASILFELGQDTYLCILLIQAPDLLSHEHGRKQILRGRPKASIHFELSQDAYLCILLMLPHLHLNEIRAEYHVPKS